MGNSPSSWLLERLSNFRWSKRPKALKFTPLRPLWGRIKLVTLLATDPLLESSQPTPSHLQQWESLDQRKKIDPCVRFPANSFSASKSFGAQGWVRFGVWRLKEEQTKQASNSHLRKVIGLNSSITIAEIKGDAQLNSRPKHPYKLSSIRWVMSMHCFSEVRRIPNCETMHTHIPKHLKPHKRDPTSKFQVKQVSNVRSTVITNSHLKSNP